MANLSSVTDISVFKFFNGSLSDFKTYYAGLTTENQEKIDNVITYIHDNNGAPGGTHSTLESGWLYANKCYYTMTKVVELTAADVTSIVGAHLETT